MKSWIVMESSLVSETKQQRKSFWGKSGDGDLGVGGRILWLKGARCGPRGCWRVVFLLVEDSLRRSLWYVSELCPSVRSWDLRLSQCHNYMRACVHVWALRTGRPTCLSGPRRDRCSTVSAFDLVTSPSTQHPRILPRKVNDFLMSLERSLVR